MPLSAEARQTILLRAKEGAFLRNARLVEGPGLEGEATVEERVATLRLVLGEGFPIDLPKVLLRPWDALGFLPHILPSGFVCYQETEGLLLDRRQPLEIVRDAIGRAIETLADGVSGRNEFDFVDEFETYWGRLNDCKSLWSLLEPTAEPRKVISATSPKKVQYVAADASAIEAFWNGDASRRYTQQRVLYLPFEPDSLVRPPRPDSPFWSVEDVRQIVAANVSKQTARWVQKAARGRLRRNETVVFSLPRPSGGFVLFGLLYRGVQGRHPLLEGGTAERVTPLRCDRLDRTFLLPRGGAYSEVTDKRVLAVGCGSVGGHLAVECARAGVMDLTLVDSDNLAPENTFRHVLGRDYWYQKKAEALEKEIHRGLPYVRVRAVPKCIEDALSDGDIEFRDYDLLLFSLGKPTIELELNEQLQALPEAPPAIFCWLEPYGVGGHAMVTNNPPRDGCFECLFTPNAGHNRAAFAAPNQRFGKAVSGCGSLFTPYGSIDAVRTAALAVGLAVDVLQGREQRNSLLSWKGNSDEFTGAGFATSARFGLSQDRLFDDRYSFRMKDCRVCGDHAG